MRGRYHRVGSPKLDASRRAVHGQHVFVRLLLLLSLTLPALPAAAGPPGKRDTTTLQQRLKKRGFKPPEGFKAVVLSLGRPVAGSPLPKPTVYSYGKTAWDRDDWWPASTVKLYAAVAALELTRKSGMRPSARATFHYADGDRRGRISGLVHQAIVPSNNLAFDRLVEVVGARHLNDRFFTRRNGFADTVMLRAYYGRVRVPDDETGHPTNRQRPAITLTDGKRSAKLPAENSRKRWRCGVLGMPDQGEGNCTTLADLSETLRRLMLHELLPTGQRFALGTSELRLLRRVLSKRKKRGNQVVDGLLTGFAQAGGGRLSTFHKPGYARRWFSDAVFVRHEASGRAWVVALAGYPGRDALDSAAKHVGALLRGLR